MQSRWAAGAAGKDRRHPQPQFLKIVPESCGGGELEYCNGVKEASSEGGGTSTRPVAKGGLPLPILDHCHAAKGIGPKCRATFGAELQ